MSYSEYQDLTPIDHIENGEEYIDKITLEIMIDCKYFEFTTSNYSAVKDVSPNLSLQFVLNNQDEYMELKTSISMTTGLFEGLICSRMAILNRKNASPISSSQIHRLSFGAIQMP